MATPIYAIGDIHGQIDSLLAALDLVYADGGPQAKIVFLGDYVDRGPDSRAVLEHLIGGVSAGKPWTCLKGNHDRMFEWFLEDQPRHDPHLIVGLHWLHERLGGATTLASYGVEIPERAHLFEVHTRAMAAVPTEHRQFLNSLELVKQAGDLLFVHAGIRPEVPLAEQLEDDLVWIRGPFLEYTQPHPYLVVHGHTALDQVAHFGNRIDLDAGAGYGRPLCPVVFEGRDCWLLTASGREPLHPLS